MYISNTLNKAIKEFGITGNIVAYSMEEDGKKPKSVSILEIGENKNIAIPSDIFE